VPCGTKTAGPKEASNEALQWFAEHRLAYLLWRRRDGAGWRGPHGTARRPRSTSSTTGRWSGAGGREPGGAAGLAADTGRGGRRGGDRGSGSTPATATTRLGSECSGLRRWRISGGGTWGCGGTARTGVWLRVGIIVATRNAPVWQPMGRGIAHHFELLDQTSHSALGLGGYALDLHGRHTSCRSKARST
jgi:hypothetical protein